MAREKEIFRDCYNLLTANLDNPNWSHNISDEVHELVNNKYDTDKKDKILCAELMGVIVNHLDRRNTK